MRWLIRLFTRRSINCRLCARQAKLTSIVMHKKSLKTYTWRERVRIFLFSAHEG